MRGWFVAFCPQCGKRYFTCQMSTVVTGRLVLSFLQCRCECGGEMYVSCLLSSVVICRLVLCCPHCGRER